MQATSTTSPLLVRTAALAFAITLAGGCAPEGRSRSSGGEGEGEGGAEGEGEGGAEGEGEGGTEGEGEGEGGAEGEGEGEGGTEGEGEGEVACAALDAAACEAAPLCQPVLGAPEEEVCAGNYDNWRSIHAGCLPSDQGCDEAETCGEEPQTGRRLIFSNGCLPDGWLPCDYCPAEGDIPAAWFACEDDGECVVFEAECCDHCNGGKAESVNRQHLEAARARLQNKDCQGVMCTRMACAPLEPVCEDGTCGSRPGPFR